MEIGYIMGIVNIIISLPLSALFLMIATKLAKFDESSYKNALMVVILANVISFGLGAILLSIFFSGFSFIVIWVLSIIMGITFIKLVYKSDWKLSILIWLLWAVVDIVAKLALSGAKSIIIRSVI